MEREMEAPGFWDDPERSNQKMKELKNLKDTVGECDKLSTQYDDILTLIDMGYEENDESLIPEIRGELDEFIREFDELRIGTLLSGEYDKNNAILKLNAGAGGTESCDWCGMLYRMYTRWAERKGFTIEVLDYLDGDEAGIKSVTFQVNGLNAYGYLKSEKGFTFAMVGFLVPFVFVYNPAILLEGNVVEIVIGAAQMLLGTFFLAVTVAGYFKRNFKPFERVALFIAALLLIAPEVISSIIGVVLGVGVVLQGFCGFLRMVHVLLHHRGACQKNFTFFTVGKLLLGAGPHDLDVGIGEGKTDAALLVHVAGGQAAGGDGLGGAVALPHLNGGFVVVQELVQLLFQLDGQGIAAGKNALQAAEVSALHIRQTEQRFIQGTWQ